MNAKPTREQAVLIDKLGAKALRIDFDRRVDGKTGAKSVRCSLIKHDYPGIRGEPVGTVMYADGSDEGPALDRLLERVQREMPDLNPPAAPSESDRIAGLEETVRRLEAKLAESNGASETKTAKRGTGK